MKRTPNDHKTVTRTAAVIALLAAIAAVHPAKAAPQMKNMHGEAMKHGAMTSGEKKDSGEVRIGNIAITGAFARMSFGKAVNSAGFMSIANGGREDDRLVAARSDISERTELHTHIHEGGVMKMRRVEGGIGVPAGKLTKLAPGGYHIMFIGLKKPLAKGDHFPLTLTFEKAGKVTLTMTARKRIPRGSHEMMMGGGK